jgi:hypothetical protein
MRLIVAMLWAVNIGLLGWYLSAKPLPRIPELDPQTEWRDAAEVRKEEWFSDCGLNQRKRGSVPPHKIQTTSEIQNLVKN